MLFQGVPGAKVVEKAHRGANEDRETGHCDRRLSVELKEGLEHRSGNTAATDTSNRAQSHDKSEDKEAADLEALLREHILVLALAAVITEIVRLLLAWFVFRTLWVVAEERLSNLRPAGTNFVESRALMLSCDCDSYQAQPKKNDLLDHFRRKS